MTNTFEDRKTQGGGVLRIEGDWAAAERTAHTTLIRERDAAQAELDLTRAALRDLITEHRQAAKNVGDPALRSAYRAVAQQLQRVLDTHGRME